MDIFDINNIIVKKIKKILLFCFLLFLSACLTNKNGIEEIIENVFEDNYINVFETDGNGSIISYNGNETTLIIPAIINGEKIITIGERAFREKGLTEVTIPDTVTHIYNSAFYRNKLTSINLPNNIVYIGNFAFAENNLTGIIIPDSVIALGVGVFNENRLAYVILSENIVAIGSGAFRSNQLTEIAIPDSVYFIGNGAFAFNQLTSLNTNKVATIGRFAFTGNTLVEITINLGVALPDDESSFPQGFDDFYRSNSKRRGTYIFVNSEWRMQ
jgi:hypothetical protein